MQINQHVVNIIMNSNKTLQSNQEPQNKFKIIEHDRSYPNS